MSVSKIEEEDRSAENKSVINTFFPSKITFFAYSDVCPWDLLHVLETQVKENKDYSCKSKGNKTIKTVQLHHLEQVGKG